MGDELSTLRRRDRHPRSKHDERRWVDCRACSISLFPGNGLLMCLICDVNSFVSDVVVSSSLACFAWIPVESLDEPRYPLVISSKAGAWKDQAQD